MIDEEKVNLVYVGVVGDVNIVFFKVDGVYDVEFNKRVIGLVFF